MKLRVDQIVADRGVQSRLGLDEATVREYAEVFRAAREAGAEAPFPAIVVFTNYAFRSTDGALWPADVEIWLADGFHRLAGAQAADVEWIACDVRGGGKREAMLHSLGANAEHGLRRSAEDKRKAVRMLLEDAEWSLWSDRAIAKQARVSDKTVATLRRELGAETSPQNRRGIDGKNYTVKGTKNENRSGLPTLHQRNDNQERVYGVEGGSTVVGNAGNETDVPAMRAEFPARVNHLGDAHQDGHQPGGSSAVDPSGEVLTITVRRPKRQRGRDLHGEFEQVWKSFLATVPAEKVPYFCGMLKTLAWQDNPEEQAANRKAWQAFRASEEKKGRRK